MFDIIKTEKFNVKYILNIISLNYATCDILLFAIAANFSNFVIMDTNAFSSSVMTDLEACADVLRRGGVVLYPTDTIWGIGCDAANEEAVKRVYAIKHRSDSKALILLTDSIESLTEITGPLSDEMLSMLQSQTGPTTVIYPHAQGIAPQVCAEDGSVAIRITSEPYSQTLCKLLGRPLVSTSANISGEPAPKCFAEISEEVKKQADFVAAYSRETPQNAAKPSRIIRLMPDGTVETLRP